LSVRLESAIWFITRACNYKCPYCWEINDQENYAPEPFIDSEKWVEGWNRLRPKILDITGGEPMLQPNFLEILKGLDKSIKLAMTTNISDDLLTSRIGQDFAKRFCSITLSYHPSQTDFHSFFWKVKFLKRRKIDNLTVNFVAYPLQLWGIQEVKEECARIGVRFHLDPYAPHKKDPFTPTDEELRYINRFHKDDNRKISGVTERFPKGTKVFCPAGMSHIQVFPNGDVYRCGAMSVGRPPIGNLFNPYFKLPEKEEFCDRVNMCYGCDWDMVHKKIKVIRKK
jgi:MoaA/NifB/PqqE/SkfB family radical SAM enzyme